MAWLKMDFNSKALHLPVSIEVLMPQLPGPYKTVYLLHGASGNCSTWLLKSQIERIAEFKPIAVVMPSGDNSFYVNMKHGLSYRNYICDELPAMCESMFNLSARREDRIISGFSMGGYGALVCGLNARETFGEIWSIAGIVDIVYRYDNPTYMNMKNIFGEREELVGSENDLYALTSRENVDKSQNIIIMCGKQDARYDMNVQFAKHMADNGYKVSMRAGDGAHEWTYVNSAIKEAINGCN